MWSVKNLSGQVFGRLTAIERAPAPETRSNKGSAYWKCQCSCGNSIVALGYSLTTGKTKSCGCLKSEMLNSGLRPPTLKPGQTFGRLTILSRAPNPGTIKNCTSAYWLCQCECGKTTTVRSYVLTTEHTQSCGCLKLEAPQLEPFSRPKYSPEISAAHLVWQQKNKNHTLSFEDFYRLSQLPCFYCGDLPSLERRAKQIDQSSSFIFNTMDRVNSSLGYTIDNVVPACLTCNRGKNDRAVADFIEHIGRLGANIDRVSPEEYRKATTLIDTSVLFEPSKYALKTSVKGTLVNYNDGDLTLKQFYQLTTTNCYYCGSPPANKRNMSNSKMASQYAKETGTFIYNGLDRIDSGGLHTYDNVVPCCKYCNWAKGSLTLSEFDAWIRRFAAHQNFYSPNPGTLGIIPRNPSNALLNPEAS